MPTCPTCGAQQPADAAFCDECGTALKVHRPDKDAARSVDVQSPTVRAALPDAQLKCSHCGAKLPAGSVFCHLCGSPVEAPTARGQVRADYITPPPQIVVGAARSASQPQPPAVPLPTVPRAPHLALEVQPDGREIVLSQDRSEYVLGRADPISRIHPDVDLTDFSGRDSGVSRQHARIFSQGGVLYLEDRNSTNHSYLNGQQLLPWRPYAIHDGDEIRLGRLKLKLRAE